MIRRRELHQLFDLNFETGELIWKKPPLNLAGKLKGTAAGTPHSEGFVRVHIHGEYYPRAQLVYYYVYGGPLRSEVRHIDGDQKNDRPENLRRLLDFPDTEITQGFLRKAFWLNRETGELFRKVEEKGRVVLENKPAGCGNTGDGRWEIHVLGRIIRRNRLVYCYAFGEMPEQISHKNGDLTDDRPNNLRPVTTAQRRMSSQGKLGRDLPRGISEQNKKCNRPFYARIKLDGRRRYLGSFETVEKAAAAYDAAARELFGEYAKPNSSLAHANS